MVGLWGISTVAIVPQGKCNRNTKRTKKMQTKRKKVGKEGWSLGWEEMIYERGVYIVVKMPQVNEREGGKKKRREREGGGRGGMKNLWILTSHLHWLIGNISMFGNNEVNKILDDKICYRY